MEVQKFKFSKLLLVNSNIISFYKNKQKQKEHSRHHASWEWRTSPLLVFQGDKFSTALISKPNSSAFYDSRAMGKRGKG